MKETINYQRIETALEYITDNLKAQPKVEDIAAHLHLSKAHFQRMFKAWAGIPPKKFLQYLTLQNLKKEINNSPNILALSETAGLSAPSRVYDLFVKIEALTPGEFKEKGKGLTIYYGYHNSPFGLCFLAMTKRGVCALDFLEGQNEVPLKAVQKRFSTAVFQEDKLRTAIVANQIFTSNSKRAIPLFLSGTPFQIKVWEALLKIPFGVVQSYQQIAHAIGNPKASRAVGSAIGQNHVGYLIPCHRVIRSVGDISEYKWNKVRKVSMIGWEKAKLED